MKLFLENFLHNKTLFISGASSGIGLALAELCLKNNSFVIAAGRSQKKLEELKKINSQNLLIVQGDLSQENFYQNLASTIKQNKKEIDILVHCAGVSFRGSSIEAQTKVYRYLMDVNFTSATRLFSFFYPALQKTQGTFAAVVSMQGLYAIPQRAPYVAAKHALRGYIDSVRREVLADSIQVMGIYPGYVASPGSVAALTEDGQAYGKLDAHRQKGLPPLTIAEAIVEGIYFKRKNIYVAGLKEKLGFYLDRFFPNLLDEFFYKKHINKNK